MKKILMCVIVTVMLVLCIGCSPIDMADATETDIGTTFSIIESGTMSEYVCYKVLVDKTTRVMYFYTSKKHSNTMTVLLDSNGKPRLYEEEQR